MKILVILHIYYQDMWNEIKKYLKNLNDYDYDLCVSLVEENDELVNSIKEFKNNSKIFFTKNVGYDIWPFIKVLQNVSLDNYDYVIKLHTKRSSNKSVIDNGKYVTSATSWHNMLYTIVSSKSNLRKIFEAFTNDNKLGMVGNCRLIVSRKSSFNEHEKYCYDKSVTLLDEMSIKYNDDSFQFIAGTMFICRAFLLKPILQKNFTENDFSIAIRNSENDSAHIMERIFGVLITSQGYEIKDVYTSFIKKVLYRGPWNINIIKYGHTSRKIRHFLYREKITSKGSKKICLCKIPIITVKNKTH